MSVAIWQMCGLQPSATIALGFMGKTQHLGRVPMTTSFDTSAADMNVSAATAGVERPSVGSPGTTTPVSGPIARAYERFLGMPVLVFLAVMWVAGAALLGSCALVLYTVGSHLVPVIAGAL